MVSKASALRGMLSGVRASDWRRHGRVGYEGQVSLLKPVIVKFKRRRRSRFINICLSYAKSGIHARQCSCLPEHSA